MTTDQLAQIRDDVEGGWGITTDYAVMVLQHIDEQQALIAAMEKAMGNAISRLDEVIDSLDFTSDRD